MYRDTLSVIKMHESMIERISGDIDDTELNVDGGKKNLIEINHRESKNRSVIIKMFAVLYVLVFVYIVFIS